jgi:hypothetical protein
MFLENSRYLTVPTVETKTRDGRTITALKLRPLPSTSGDPYAVKDNDQLDVLAHGITSDGTKFWHIADANTALDARTLEDKAGVTIRLPRK